MRVVVVNHISLDGVIQAPARQDEDTRGDFAHGGWADSTMDPAMSQVMGEVMGERFSWLFGHRSYDDMLTHWNQAGGPFKDGLNAATKYVASRRADPELPWPNSELLTGDVPAEVARLREQLDKNLVIMGSAQLIQSLLPHDLIDDLVLFVNPIVLGSGLQMFGTDPTTHRFRLVSANPTASSLLITRYEAIR